MPNTQQGTPIKDTSSGKPDSSLTSEKVSPQVQNYQKKEKGRWQVLNKGHHYMGWALQIAETGYSFSNMKKSYLFMQFESDKTTENKVDALDVSKHMRQAKMRMDIKFYSDD